MNTLHTFGCSYTAYFENNNGRSQYEEYKKFRGGFYPKVWPELLSEKLGMELNNTAIGGSSNYEIFQLFFRAVGYNGHESARRSCFKNKFKR